MSLEELIRALPPKAQEQLRKQAEQLYYQSGVQIAQSSARTPTLRMCLRSVSIPLTNCVVATLNQLAT
ncbi:MAG: hypothetical protein NZ843_06780 [Fimbriimonadales bacterium]|nr:hypothetical protein [Fimbriimonadales bacterium]